ncbi:MAG: hypothetical protein JW819_06020 [Candidatus Krumholzibacteriota bacterium]|nr:hypothetical protein [Candidatus Krumholzibacteriota bacterium]
MHDWQRLDSIWDYSVDPIDLERYVASAIAASLSLLSTREAAIASDTMTPAASMGGSP